MSIDWEEKFTNWAKPPAQTEQDKCDNAKRAITHAIDADEKLSNHSLTVFPQGSYRNRTNVRLDSDVDICVLCTDSFFFDLPMGMQAADFKINTSPDYSYSQFKNDVEQALVSYFGRGAVSRGEKAFDIHENTYRIDADVVAAFEYRYYLKDGRYYEGTAFLPDQGERIFNWPEQHYERGVAKNEATGKRFKSVVRILKRLRNEMEAIKIADAKDVASFLIESLVYNVLNEGFGHETYMLDVRYVLASVFNATLKDETCSEWVEVNDLTCLFHSDQPWTREQAHIFVSAAWNYVGFK